MSDAFDVSVYLMACARDCLDEPPLFGPRRMVEAAARLAAGPSSDPALLRLRERITERRGALLGMDRDGFAEWLDDVTGELARSALERELAAEAEHDGLRSPGPAQSVRDLVDRLWAAYNAHDVNAAVALYAADGTHHEVAQGRRVEGREDVGNGLTRFLSSFPDASWEQHRVVVSDSNAAVAYRLTGTLAAPLGPFRTPGQRLDLEGMFLIESAGGAIVGTADYWDAATFTRQMQAAA
ncbi:MAG TPA: DUF6092 family protein [Solirubrobacteraceae bacterium]|nr:DUF6092 family protein [Solirubrobacteraceae bacterium]